MTAALDAEAARPNRRKAAKQATRARVLAAAEALFKAGGYADATIRDIAKAMGMSTGAVFANFDSKAEIWTAVFGGPPPSPEIADEIARTLGDLRDHSWTLSHHKGLFHAAITGPGYNPVTKEGPCFLGRGASPAAALRTARESASAAGQPLQAAA